MLETKSEPRFELELDTATIYERAAERAVELLRARVETSGHSQTGAFAESFAAQVSAEGVTVGPTGERNQIIAKVFKSRGLDFVTLTAEEQADVAQVMDQEIRRQLGAGVAKAV